jgi:hypothetical protein
MPRCWKAASELLIPAIERTREAPSGKAAATTPAPAGASQRKLVTNIIEFLSKVRQSRVQRCALRLNSTLHNNGIGGQLD